MATQTQVRKTKPRSKNQRVGKTANIPSKPRTKKPKTFKQWAGQRGSKWMEGHWSTRGIRATYRFARREAEGIRRRRADTRAGKPHSKPSRRAALATKARQRRQKFKGGARKILGLDQLTHCGGCGQNFVNARAYHAHACAQNHGTKQAAPRPKTKPASNAQPAQKAPTSPPGSATLGAAAAAIATGARGGQGWYNANPAPTPAPAPAVTPPMQDRSEHAGELGPNHAKSARAAKARRWRKANTAQRKKTMNFGKRFADRTGREVGALTGATIKCAACGWKLHPGEDHDCQGHAQQSTPAATTAPAPASSPQPAAQPAGKTPAVSKTSKPATPPSGGSTTGKGAAVAAPAAAPSNNGAPQPSGGGTGPGVGLAAAIEQAVAAWCQDIPEFHDDMIAKMNTTREVWARIGNMFQEHAGQLVAADFHPECVSPLLSISASMIESSNHFTNVLMAIERVYQGPLAHYRSGIPDPGEKYLSSGRKTGN